MTGERYTLIQGDSLAVLPTLAARSVDAIVTDPPYGLAFMGKAWDHSVPGVEFWEAVLRLLKPGGYMLAMGGTRTYHRLACAVEDAGFEIRDCLMWLYGQGFPKGKGCLKPAWEPVLLARKPGKKVLPLGIDECRIPAPGGLTSGGCKWKHTSHTTYAQDAYTVDNPAFLERSEEHPAGRWPANVILDEEAVAMLDEQAGPQKSGGTPARRFAARTKNAYGDFSGEENPNGIGRGTGSTSRFFYCAKASRRERNAGLEGLPEGPPRTLGDFSGDPTKSGRAVSQANTHPTVKPLALMRWLVKLACPEGATVLDPFMGSGSTGKACLQTGRRFIGIEKEPAYCEIARKRLETADAEARANGPGTRT